MKKIESVFREILYQAIEEKNFVLTQSELSKRLGLSLSIINSAVKKLESIGAVKIELRSFRIMDIKKILYYGASVRNLAKDIILSARIEIPVREIERIMPEVSFTAFTAYKLRFSEAPANYSEVYVYASEDDVKEIKKRIKEFKAKIYFDFEDKLKKKVKNKERDINPNLIIIKKDPMLSLYKQITLSQIFADLWNINKWYSKDFINSMEERLKIN